MNEKPKNLQETLEEILWRVVDEGMRILPEKETAQERMEILRSMAGILSVCGVKARDIKS